ncbi:MAG: hypothetical protein MI923_15780 [Phycisphaerales bacterium]|nr:hypothetical protein [Phycisphaerales bacterium]
MRLRFPRLQTLKWIGFSSVFLLTGLWAFIWNYDIVYYWRWGACGAEGATFYCMWTADIELESGVNARQAMESEGWFRPPNPSTNWKIQQRVGGPPGTLTTLAFYSEFDDFPFLRHTAFPMWLLWPAAFCPTVILFFMGRRIPKGHCQRCGYDLAGNVSGTCPECGVQTNYRVPLSAYIRRALRYGRLTLAVLILAVTLLVCYYARSSAPTQIIAAVRSQEGVQVLKPLNQHKGVLWTRLSRGRRYNWDGKYLCVTGRCPRCWKPGARPGAFVLAKLPTGLVYATHESRSPDHAHLSKPKPISPKFVLTIGISLASLIAVGPSLVRRSIKCWARPKRRMVTTTSPVNSPTRIDL